MLNMNIATQALADNEIRINNVVVGHLTDADAKHLWDIVKGMVNLYGSEGTAQASAPKSGLIFEEDLAGTGKLLDKTAPKPIKAAEDVDVTIEGKDNAVWYSCTSRDVRQIVNGVLKEHGFTYDKDFARPDTYKKPYTDRDGIRHEVGEHKKGAWVAMKGNKRDLATAKLFIGETITVTAQEREVIRNQWAERKARREG